jgi:hypothetical protein
MLSDTDADSEANDLALCLIRKRNAAGSKNGTNAHHNTVHTREFHDRLNTEGAKRLKILSAILRSII